MTPHTRGRIIYMFPVYSTSIIFDEKALSPPPQTTNRKAINNVHSRGVARGKSAPEGFTVHLWPLGTGGLVKLLPIGVDVVVVPLYIMVWRLYFRFRNAQRCGRIHLLLSMLLASGGCWANRIHPRQPFPI